VTAGGWGSKCETDGIGRALRCGIFGLLPDVISGSVDEPERQHQIFLYYRRLNRLIIPYHKNKKERRRGHREPKDTKPKGKSGSKDFETVRVSFSFDYLYFQDVLEVSHSPISEEPFERLVETDLLNRF